MSQGTRPGLPPLLAIEGLGEPPPPGAPFPPVTWTGLPPAARALALLHLAAPLTVPVVVVVRGDAEMARLSADLRALAGLTGAFPEAGVIAFPALDADPYDGIGAHMSVVCERLRALWMMRSGAARVVVVPARALLLPLPPASALEPFFVTVRAGGALRQAHDDAWLRAARYRRVDLVNEPGDYSRRGGILDIFPPVADNPIRIELDGHLVASLRSFSPADQRSTGRLEQAELSPARETVLGGPELDNLRASLRGGEAGRRLQEELETRGSFPGLAAFARVIYPGARGLLETLESLCGRPPLLAVDELQRTLDALREEKESFLRAAGPDGEAMGLPAPSALLVPEGQAEGALPAAPLRLRELAIRDEEQEEARARLDFRAAAMPSYRGRLPELMDLVRAETAARRTVWFLVKSEGRAQLVRRLLAEHDLSAGDLSAQRAIGGDQPAILLGIADVGAGFVLPEARLVVVAEHEVFGEEPRYRKKSALPTFTSDFRDLNPGDMVVHVDHGVGRYEGLSRVGEPGSEVDVMILSYQGEDKLFVPVTRLDLVQKYSGVGGRAPTLDKLGGTGWVKTKQRVKKAMQDMAAELLNLYAARKAVKGHAFGPDTAWQQEFEATFPYELTIDQQIAVNEIKRDLEASTPMDRLLCGDVGFGKTEVAMRAAFKVVMEGKQVAVLAPTTVLVFQHHNTFRERFAAFPVRVESLSRFKNPREQKTVAAAAAAGGIDILIGTHRMLSQDVAFKDLGLLVVDEEQRFGVAHKEKLKKLKRSVDVLTLTATPIPRTLQMSLMGVRDLSVIETPPENRLAIQTHLLPFKDAVLAPAIEHELARGGQVYFVHNRVESVYAMAALLRKLVPRAEYAVAHGQMDEGLLEETMLRFLRGDFQVLVSTTIIENGLDIPRVNTLIVNRADQFGLSQLYQLRGRIGRSDRQAYAYLLVPPERTLTEVARKRLKTLQEFSDLGSGFRIAAIDLEIRGAGNLLGRDQHGHIASLGFELYCRMLERAVQELRSGEAEVAEGRAAIHLSVDLKIPESYIPDEHHRLMFYKKIASVSSLEALDAIRDEMQDRYGRLPRQGLNLVEVAGLRILAEKLRVQQIDYRTGSLSVKFSEATPVEPERLLGFVSRRSDAAFSPPALLRVKIDAAEAGRIALAREVLTALA
ncbi:MAG TPA: transcription-repair coupling factor [Candidatus Polarisedimenticolia bacterium]|nr:transcription-repair coupling factor [Candidatus Polarisedimenticolia bacterium]